MFLELIFFSSVFWQYCKGKVIEISCRTGCQESYIIRVKLSLNMSIETIEFNLKFMSKHFETKID